jgi:hypothetical protein
MKARLGPPKAINAVAHKVARIVYHMITRQQEYDTTIFQDQERRVQDRKRKRLCAQGTITGLSIGARRGCSLGGPVSASPGECEYALHALQSSCRSRSFHPRPHSVLTVCVSPGGKRTGTLLVEFSLYGRFREIYRRGGIRGMRCRSAPLNKARWSLTIPREQTDEPEPICSRGRIRPRREKGYGSRFV